MHNIEASEYSTFSIDDEEWLELGKSIEIIWNLDAIQITYKFSKYKKIFWFADNMDYFLDKISNIIKPQYIVTKDQ